MKKKVHTTQFQHSLALLKAQSPFLQVANKKFKPKEGKQKEEYNEIMAELKELYGFNSDIDVLKKTPLPYKLYLAFLICSAVLIDGDKKEEALSVIAWLQRKVAIDAGWVDIHKLLQKRPIFNEEEVRQ